MDQAPGIVFQLEGENEPRSAGRAIGAILEGIARESGGLRCALYDLHNFCVEDPSLIFEPCRVKIDHSLLCSLELYRPER